MLLVFEQHCKKYGCRNTNTEDDRSIGDIHKKLIEGQELELKAHDNGRCTVQREIEVGVKAKTEHENKKL